MCDGTSPHHYEFYSIKELCNILNVSRSTPPRWEKTNGLPKRRGGRLCLEHYFRFCNKK
jgi:excisionase family DNA binding protein